MTGTIAHRLPHWAQALTLTVLWAGILLGSAIAAAFLEFIYPWRYTSWITLPIMWALGAVITTMFVQSRAQLAWFMALTLLTVFSTPADFPFGFFLPGLIGSISVWMESHAKIVRPAMLGLVAAGCVLSVIAVASPAFVGEDNAFQTWGNCLLNLVPYC